MKIVILDGHTLNPGDLSWEGLSKFGELKAYERTPPELVAERCAEAEIIITNKALVTRETIDSLPALRYKFCANPNPGFQPRLVAFRHRICGRKTPQHESEQGICPCWTTLSFDSRPQIPGSYGRSRNLTNTSDCHVRTVLPARQPFAL